jgi:hypothetical protein
MVTPHFDGCIVENPALPGAAMLTSGRLDGMDGDRLVASVSPHAISGLRTVF